MVELTVAPERDRRVLRKMHPDAGNIHIEWRAGLCQQLYAEVHGSLEPGSCDIYAKGQARIERHRHILRARVKGIDRVVVATGSAEARLGVPIDI